MNEFVADPLTTHSPDRRTFGNLPMLPRVTSEILRLVDDPSSTIADLNRVVSHDPGLSCRILKVVNSSFYGLSRQIGSLERAIPILGLRVTRNLAIIASMDKFFQIGRSSDVFRAIADDLWRHATATAAASRMIAEVAGIDRLDEIFLAGLIHDLGIIAELHMDRARLLDAMSLTCPDIRGIPDRSLCEIERHLFGADHETTGMEMCEQWKFPAFLCQATGFHHRPLELAADARLRTSVVSVADCIASSLDGAFRLDMQSFEIADELLDVVHLTRNQLDNTRNQLIRRADEIELMFS